MEALTKLCWILLALLHLAPSLALFRPGMVERLYGVPASGDLGVLLTHRAALFLAVLVACVFAAAAPEARRLASIVCAISMIGFLVVYVSAGAEAGPLRRIAVADAVGLLPLAFVAWRAWS